MIGPIHAREHYFAKAAREIAQDAMTEQKVFNTYPSITADQAISPFLEWAEDLVAGDRSPGLLRMIASRALLLAVHYERLEAIARQEGGNS